jgi:hypothetical protein
MRPQQRGGGARRSRLTAAGVSAALVGALCVIGGTTTVLASASTTAASTSAGASDHGNQCRLGNGIKHVIQIGFDNVHYFRDNPNVPSDLQLMPNLLNFFKDNGTFLSNSHTPLIAHTAVDLLTTATGLYGDRQGVGISNSYQSYSADGTTDPATAFTYWTDPIYDTANTPNAGHDVNPTMVYSPVPPSTASSPVSPTTVAPAPWVPYAKAGCNVGEIATANQELENAAFDIPKVFGTGSPEAQQLAADSSNAPFYDNEVRDYVGLGVHCGKDSALCANAQAVKFGQTTPSHTATADLLPNEPGGYNGYQALFGSKYIAPELGGGTPSLTQHGVPVTDAAGNLTDLFGNEITDPFATPGAGFPGYDINAPQSLAYAADMLEHGVQVVNLYMADIHGNQFLPNSPQVPTMGTDCGSQPDALGSGSQCYIDQAKYYNQAFGVFFQRLAADGITRQNTLFVLSSDEGDHQAGANVGRAVAPTPAGCDGVTVPCTYTSSNFGEITVATKSLLTSQTGHPAPDAPVVRKFEHDVASLTNPLNPYSGTANEKITNYLANPVEEGILHFVNADPARTATLAMFAKPDYYLQAAPLGFPCKGQQICQTNGFAWDHGDYAAEINTNYVGFVGPGVQQLGVDGPSASEGPSSAGPNSGQTVVADYHFRGPWVDETDIRPTMMYLTGLTDDYEHDGRVISQILTDPNSALSQPGVTKLGECYKQLNSSVGNFGAATLVASTKALESTSAGDATFLSVEGQLRALAVARDHLAGLIKGELEAAAFEGTPIFAAPAQIRACEGLIHAANKVASAS